MLCAILIGPTYADLERQLQEALPYADLVECRLDRLSKRNFTELNRLCDMAELPLLFTLRKRTQGGHYSGSEEQRLAEIKALLKLHPSYFDVEGDSSPEFIIEQHPETAFIVSAHYFEENHPPLEDILKTLPEATYYKIAVQVSNTVSALKLLEFARARQNLILIGMGNEGQITRILGPVFGIPITYAALNESEATAPGQLTLQILHDTYRTQELSADSRLYSLLGDPISKSISDKTHNSLFKALGQNAVYVKMRVASQELEETLSLTFALNFQGHSVTTPLKEAVIPFLEEVDAYATKIGAVNTLIRGKNRFIGINTDGPGALNAIQKHLEIQSKSLVVLGAGPAARAIAYEAKERGAMVTLANRTQEKGIEAAHQIGVEFTSLDKLPSYDLIVNATSSALPLDPSQLKPGVYAMDIATSPKLTLFLEEAAKKGNSLIYGYEMFVEQALLQFKLWGYPQEELMHEILLNTAESIL